MPNENMNDPDVLIIGSGQAGAPLSWRLARNGRSVVLVERGHLGGTCVNVGCTPTKTFIASAEVAHHARRGAALGVRSGSVTVDMAAVVARKREVVETWRSGVASNVEKAGDGLRLVRGHARFTGPGTVTVDGETFSPGVVIVNCGARPVVPPIPGLADVAFLDNALAMELTELPDHLLVLGGGYIGCELGQAFRRFGAAVSIVDEASHLMGREDADVSEALEEAFIDEGIELHLGARAARVDGLDDGGVRLTLEGGKVLDGTHLLVAVGRRPNTDDLGVEAGGIEVDGQGFLQVDDHYRTSADGVYAVGDCTGGPQFTHASWDDHRILFDLLNGNDRRNRAGRVIPYSSFTDPQVARVGMSEREAEESGEPHEVATLPFARIARAHETGRTAGLVKVILHSRTERILGAAVVGAEGAELITIFQAMMLADAPASVLVDGQMIHPAFAEGVQSALMKLPRYALS
jgi:pyruvate/2-oxoglutarate dehydrogenase complex dihydrolipoamide dehydrogenase (E3) component